MGKGKMGQEPKIGKDKRIFYHGKKNNKNFLIKKTMCKNESI